MGHWVAAVAALWLRVVMWRCTRKDRFGGFSVVIQAHPPYNLSFPGTMLPWIIPAYQLRMSEWVYGE